MLQLPKTIFYFDSAISAQEVKCHLCSRLPPSPPKPSPISGRGDPFSLSNREFEAKILLLKQSASGHVRKPYSYNARQEGKHDTGKLGNFFRRTRETKKLASCNSEEILNFCKYSMGLQKCSLLTLISRVDGLFSFDWANCTILA